MNPLALLVAAAFPVLLGLLGRRLAPWLAAPADGVLYRATLYVLGGALVLHLALTLLDFAGIPWNPFLLAALGAALYLLAGRILPRGPRGPERAWSAAGFWSEWGWGDGVALFVLAAFTAFALTGWITFGDFVYHWGLKGERFYLARGVDYAYLARGWNWVLHPDYPNLLPEIYAAVALLTGGFEPRAMMLETCAFAALTLAAAREGLRQGEAGGFTLQMGLALISLVLGAFGIGFLTAGGADWMLALALAAAVPPLLRPPDRAGDFQIAVIAAFAAASKIEGLPLAAFLVGVQWSRRVWAEERQLAAAAVAAMRLGLPVAAVVLPWLGRAVHHHLLLASNTGRFDPARVPGVAAAVLETLRDTGAWHGFLVAIFLPPLLLLSRRARPFAAVATLQLAFDLYIYCSAPMADTRYFVLSNFARLGFQLIPASLVAALVTWGPAREPEDSRPLSASAW
jgi:hypothetical protein